MSALRNLDALLRRAEEALIGVLLIVASFVLFANVVARYGFNDSFPWAEELTRYAIVWMVFIGSSLAASKGAHISVDVLLRVLGDGRVGRALVIGIDLACAVFSVFLVVFGWDLVAQAREFGQVTPSMQVPLWAVQLAMPVGGLLMCLRFTQRFLAALAGEVTAPATDISS
jgi:C4-dicarboxylate transporter, DctQ subunit